MKMNLLIMMIFIFATVAVADPAPRASSARNLSVCPGPSAVHGFDVSDSIADIQWLTANKAGYDFTFIKASEGNGFSNPDFKTAWTAAGNAGMVRGAYHYFRPSVDPTAQANTFLKTVGSLTTDDLAPMLDWETTDGMSNATQIARALVWLQAVEKATGKTPYIYVSPGFFNALGNPVQFARYPLYIADWTGGPCPNVPPPWSTWAFWQDAIGPISGIATQTDKDLFNGAGTALDILANVTPAAQK